MLLPLVMLFLHVTLGISIPVTAWPEAHVMIGLSVGNESGNDF